MSTQTPTIIVVNDDPDQVQLIKTAIEQDGFHVVGFYNAQNALNYIHQHPSIDLIVTDLNMAGIDGWQFCRYLRSPDYPQTNKTPILVTSATFAGGNGPNIIREIGADAFLSVPFRLKALRETVRELLKRPSTVGAPVALLIVAEDAERHALSTGLAAHGYHVVQAGNGEQGWQCWQAQHPDLVVIGHVPPQIDGMALLTRFREKPSDQKRPTTTLVVLNSSETAWASQMLQAGADACIYRPFDVLQLIDRATTVSRERAIRRVENMLEMRTREALHYAEHIRQLSEVFVSLGVEPEFNIQTLTETAGRLLGGRCAFHSAINGDQVRIAAEWQLPDLRGLVTDCQNALCHQVLLAPNTAPVTIRHLSSLSYAQSLSFIGQLKLETLVGCPILVGEQRVGTICVLYDRDHVPTPENLDTLQLLARAIGQQIQIQQRNRELALLNDISRTIASALSLEQMLSRLGQEVKELVHAQICAIVLADHTTGELVIRQIDAEYVEAKGHRLRPGQGLTGRVFIEGKAVLLTEVKEDSPVYLQHTGWKIKDAICVPLIVQERTIGVLELFNKRESRFTNNDLRLVESVAAQVASVIENARLHEETRNELNERIRVEKALRESERRLQTFIDATPDLIFLKDANLIYQLVNNKMARRLGLDISEIIGKTDLELVPPEQAMENCKSDQQVLESGQAVNFELQIGGRTIEVHKIPVRDDDGQITGIAGVIHDITERKESERQCAERQRAESVLTLAGGIAHDFNNALVGIVGNIGLLRMDFSDVPEIMRSLDAMDASAQRMVELTNQLLAYAGGGKYQLFVINVATMIEQALQTVQTQVREPDVVADCEFASDLWPVNGDPAQIKRMFFNLILNAYEAMAETGGTLLIRGENVHRQAWKNGYGVDFPDGDYVHIAILDTGKGIDETIRSHLFEPFFTTKFQGRGLGLPAAMGIVRSHRGDIQIESQFGRGTTVHVYLPRAQQPTAKPVETTQTARKTIMVVEDDETVRNLVQRILSRQGYELVVVDNGQAALDAYRQRKNEIDLVLLDIGLPQMGGNEVLNALKKENPQVKVLLSSGYDELKVMEGRPVNEYIGFIQKPYSIQSLVSTVQNMLR